MGRLFDWLGVPLTSFTYHDLDDFDLFFTVIIHQGSQVVNLPVTRLEAFDSLSLSLHICTSLPDSVLCLSDELESRLKRPNRVCRYFPERDKNSYLHVCFQGQVGTEVSGSISHNKSYDYIGWLDSIFYSDFLTFFLACAVTFYLTFYGKLASILAFSLLYLASCQAFILAFVLTFSLTFSLAFFLAFYLASILTFCAAF